jgi:uncharacterized protein YjiS (DUF1127 family)
MFSGMRGAWRAFQQFNGRRSAARKLSGLDDFMLKDMGLSRSEIGEAVSGRRHRRGALGI